MVQVKQYWVYAGDDYYPRKVFGDLKQSFDDLEEAISYAKNLNPGSYDWVTVVDIQNRKEVYNR